MLPPWNKDIIIIIIVIIIKLLPELLFLHSAVNR